LFFNRGSYFNSKTYYEISNLELPEEPAVVIDLIFKPELNSGVLVSALSSQNLQREYSDNLGVETDTWDFSYRSSQLILEDSSDASKKQEKYDRLPYPGQSRKQASKTIRKPFYSSGHAF
jgi:hypothetical protein